MACELVKGVKLCFTLAWNIELELFAFKLLFSLSSTIPPLLLVVLPRPSSPDFLRLDAEGGRGMAGL